MSQEVEKVEDIACIDLNISLVAATSQNQEERILLPASVDQEETEGESVEVEETEEGGEIRDYSVVWGRVGSWPWWPGVVSPVSLVSPASSSLGKTLLRKVDFFGEDDRGINTHSYLVSGGEG